jgi:hypothetical protein
VAGQFQPHQLDYDWRFDSKSQYRIAAFAKTYKDVALLGCPSLMEPLASQISTGSLFERNPNQVAVSPFSLCRCDLRIADQIARAAKMYDLAILDSPWYSDDLFVWINTALSIVNLGGAVLFVLWPEDIRPLAPIEHENIRALLRNVGELQQIGTVTYETPLFERLSLREAGARPFQRMGLLFKLTKEKSESLAHHVQIGSAIWKRFSIGVAQVAIKLDPQAKNDSGILGFYERPFALQSTSRRDPALANINIWTSENVVGRLKNPSDVAQGLEAGSPPYLKFVKGMFRKSASTFENAQVMTWEHRE